MQKRLWPYSAKDWGEHTWPTTRSDPSCARSCGWDRASSIRPRQLLGQGGAAAKLSSARGELQATSLDAFSRARDAEHRRDLAHRRPTHAGSRPGRVSGIQLSEPDRRGRVHRPGSSRQMEQRCRVESVVEPGEVGRTRDGPVEEPPNWRAARRRAARTGWRRGSARSAGPLGEQGLGSPARPGGCPPRGTGAAAGAGPVVEPLPRSTSGGPSTATARGRRAR